MKVIDLLNKIANGEDELPNKIQYYDDIYSYVGNDTYVCTETNKILSDEIYANHYNLNYEFKIIEDNKIETLELEPLDMKNDFQRQIELVHYENIIIANKINEIIDKMNKE